MVTESVVQSHNDHQMDGRVGVVPSATSGTT